MNLKVKIANKIVKITIIYQSRGKGKNITIMSNDDGKL